MTAATATLSPQQRRRLLVDWNATERPYPTGDLLHEPFERQAQGQPDAIALRDGDQQVSYGALAVRAHRWAQRLRRAGAGPEVVVGVHLTRSAEMVAVLLGVLRAGAAYLPLDPSYPPDRLELMAGESRMALLVTGDPAPALRHRATVLTAGGREPDTGPRRELPAPTPGRVAGSGQGRAQPANLAYILYTSGSTGRPKGAAITHSNASDLLHWSVETFGDALARVLATTSICFDCSILEIFGPLSYGGTAVLAGNALDVAAGSTGHDVRLLHAVPSVMAELVRLGRLPRSVTTVLLGGEAPWPRLVDDIHRHSRVERLINVYGPTECTSYSTWAVVDRATAAAPPIGRPVANTGIYLLDRRGELVTVGAPGEIYIAGRGLARGYLHRPGLTAERFLPDPFAAAAGQRRYRTGDLARYDESGVLSFVGRIDDQVKVRGVRVEPTEVEQALLRHPSVAEAAVVAPDDGQVRRRLLAYVVLSCSSVVPPAEFRSFLAASLPPAMLPDRFFVLDRLPRTPNGKLDRRQLLTHLADADTAPGSGSPRYVAPRDELEACLAGIWAEMFERERVGVYDDFYTLGGHSLAALRIRARVGAALAVELPVERIFAQRTIASLAQELRPLIADDRAGAAPEVVAAGTGTVRTAAPLSPNQRAIWRWAKRDPGDPTLNLPVCVRITGDFNPPALALAVAELVRRHEVLRTAVRQSDNGALEQVTEPVGMVPLPLVDLSTVPVERRADLARDLSFGAGQAPVDLARPPILHARLFRLAPDDHVFALTLHQLVADVWSMGAAGRQLLDLYHAAATASRPRLLPPSVQYPDWARQQVEWLASTAGHAQRRFWRERLADLPNLRLWSSPARLDSTRATSAGHLFMVTGDLINRLAGLASDEAATLHMVLLSAYQLLLSRWADQPEVVVGCPTTGRVQSDLPATIGSFVNALVMPAHLDGDPSFRALLRRTRDQAWEAYAHQDVPFAQLVTDLAADQDPTRHPIYQASIAVHYLEKEQEVPAGMAVVDFGRRPPPHTSLDLELNIYVGDAGAECGLTYRTDLAGAAEVARFAESYVAMLERVASAPDRPVSQHLPSGAGPIEV